ncbi:MAG: 3'-5' exonuclease [Gammaproteobacteria bacterium]|nr:3'-5' exonuclease [Gammaproteobacteria bacterium]
MIRGLAQWLGFGRPEEPARAARWVVIDCETSGLDPLSDRLLSIGAVAVQGGRLNPADSFAAVLQQEAASSAENILVHGIGGDAQRGGVLAAEALSAFSRYLDGGLPVGFHSPFDAAVLGRAMKARTPDLTPARWLDLAPLAAALNPAHAARARALDDWLGIFGIECPARHDALADAFASAQLLLVLLAQAAGQGVHTVRALRALERDARWIARA